MFDKNEFIQLKEETLVEVVSVHVDVAPGNTEGIVEVQPAETATFQA